MNRLKQVCYADHGVPVSVVILGQREIRDGGEARCSETNPGRDCKETANFHSSDIWR